MWLQCIPLPPVQSSEARCVLEEPLDWADGFLVVYNISDRTSFLNAKGVLRQIRETRADNCKGSEVILFGCLVASSHHHLWLLISGGCCSGNKVVTFLVSSSPQDLDLVVFSQTDSFYITAPLWTGVLAALLQLLLCTLTATFSRITDTFWSGMWSRQTAAGGLHGILPAIPTPHIRHHQNSSVVHPSTYLLSLNYKILPFAVKTKTIL